MPEIHEDSVGDQTNPALDEFVESAARVNEGLSEMISCALRMQMLIMEDARNMIAELRVISAAAGMRGASEGDI
jgi:hypothetical protein